MISQTPEPISQEVTSQGFIVVDEDGVETKDGMRVYNMFETDSEPVLQGSINEYIKR